MFARRGTLVFQRGKDRLFEKTNQFVTLMVGLCVGVMWADNKAKINSDDTAVISSKAFDLALQIPLYGILDVAFRNENRESITVSIIDLKRNLPVIPHPAISETRGFNEIIFYPITPLFVQFYEDNKLWLKEKFKEQENWPTIFLFIAAVRNAISHGNKVHFTSIKAKDVEWHHVRFGRADNGKKILGEAGLLSVADLFFLMIEMADELDRLNCPNNG